MQLGCVLLTNANAAALRPLHRGKACEGACAMYVILYQATMYVILYQATMYVILYQATMYVIL
jgi:hypothetical protein